MKNKIQAVIAAVHDRFFVLGISLVFILVVDQSCNTRKELLDEAVYEGPLVTMDSVLTKMSDSARVTVILKAPKQNDFEGGDREWPESLYLEYLDKNGSITSTFKANYVYYTSEKDLYKAEGNVIVRNMENGDELNTEELFWDPAHEQFYTERFVTIQSEDEIHTGEGLTADQDFSSYTILKPQGTISIEE
ncbi:MAG: LPS export ABC transporter protein LptC [Marinoscillum sp.]|jgi:LPS export ABC transporter protein LptC